MDGTGSRLPANRMFLTILLVLLIGCAAVGPDYVPPAIHLPDKWHSTSAKVATQDSQLRIQWWQAFEDSILIDLIHAAVDGNRDAEEAGSRVREARFRRLQSRSTLFPTLEASGSARQSGTSESGGAQSKSDLYTAGFDATWELDLFGGARRSMEAAQADLEAEIEGYHDVMVSLLAEVAVNYIELRTYQARLAVAERNITAQQETWELVCALSRAGSSDELTVAQARYNLESSRSKIPDLKVGQEAALNRLAVLTGRPAGALHDRLVDTRPLPRVCTDPASAIPADVILQRPDIRRAERELAAQTARIGEAEADVFPRFVLNGSIGLEALSAGKLLSFRSRTWSFGPSLSWSIFDAGSIRSDIKVQEELRQQALFRYEATVLYALEEVENALVAYNQEQQKLERLQAAAEAARSAADLAGHQFTTGMTGFSDVLDAQRSLLDFEDQVAESRGASLSKLVRLYKALGGGWQSFERPAGPEAKSRQGITS